MDASAPRFLVALEASGFGLAIRQSPWAYPAANVGHVVAVVLFFAAVVVIDLALLGRIGGGHALAMRARRAAMSLFGCVAVTGLVLFTAEASHLAVNPVFQLKIAVILAALANALLAGPKSIARLADAGPTSRAGRDGIAWAAAISLVLWLTVVALGRLIAYL